MGPLVRSHAELGDVVADARYCVMNDDANLGIIREVQLPVLEGEREINQFPHGDLALSVFKWVQLATLRSGLALPNL
jgi:hypothetical protein